jgi:hypothetical protein
MKARIPFIISLLFVLGALTGLLIKGGTSERRYETTGCQHRMIYEYTPDPQIGLLTLGGSRLRVSTSARHFNEILAEIRPDALPPHNLSHNIYSVDKEYVVLRDMLDKHTVKTALVMIEPRKAEFGSMSAPFAEIAKLSDIPLAVHAVWPENKINAVRGARDIVFQHIDAFSEVGSIHKGMSLQDCDREDYRLNIGGLDKAQTKFMQVSGRALEWDLTDPSQEGFLRWMRAFKDLSEHSGTQIIFLLMTGTSEPLPAPSVRDQFFETTGLRLITLDRDIHDELSLNGKRDSSHINKVGRDVLLPWLVAQIEDVCNRDDGCL